MQGFATPSLYYPLAPVFPPLSLRQVLAQILEPLLRGLRCVPALLQIQPRDAALQGRFRPYRNCLLFLLDDRVGLLGAEYLRELARLCGLAPAPEGADLFAQVVVFRLQLPHLALQIIVSVRLQLALGIPQLGFEDLLLLLKRCNLFVLLIQLLLKPGLMLAACFLLIPTPLVQGGELCPEFFLADENAVRLVFGLNCFAR